VSAVLKATETPDLNAGLAAIRKGIADATAALNRAESERVRCEAEAVQLQAIVDRLPVFREKVAALYEAQASGDESAAKKILAVEKDLETQAEISGRAELNVRGVRAAARKFQHQVEAAQNEVERLRREFKRAAVGILHDMFLASRREYKQACAAFAAGPMTQHFAIAAAAAALARELGLSKQEMTQADLRDPTPGFGFQTSLTNNEMQRDGSFVEGWTFYYEQQEPFARRTAEQAAKLRAELGIE
jgi:hypothetical protein